VSTRRARPQSQTTRSKHRAEASRSAIVSLTVFSSGCWVTIVVVSVSQPILSPFAPGESPFRTKGTIWAGICDFITEHVPGGSASVVERLEPPYRAFLTQMFVAIGWYDLLPIARIALAIADAMGVDKLEYVQKTATFQADRDMAGVYKRLLAQSTPEGFCRRYASFYAQIYDFGKAEILNEAPRCIDSTAYGVPELLGWWWMRASEVYLERVLSGAGAREPKVTWTACTPNGERSGMKLLQISARTTWS
jgi:hypothetical protein